MKDSYQLAAAPGQDVREEPASLENEILQHRGEAGHLLTAKNVIKSYRKGKHSIPVLLGVDFSVHAGEFVSIVGQSGSGKSTLLHVLGLLDTPDEGEVHFGGQRIDDRSAATREAYRNHSVGMVFQFYHLLPELSALENVLMPLMIAEGPIQYWRKKRAHVERAKDLLDRVGLGHRMTHKPRELSGGEMQRAAIGRALISQPRLLLADEPTGNLDAQNGSEILDILRSLNAEQNLTIVMVTHDNVIANQADRLVRLSEGMVRSRAAA